MKLDDYLSKSPELKALYKLVKEDFSTKGLVHHNWHHILRSLATAIIIGEAEKASMKIVLASVLLHDIGRLYSQLGKNHYAAGAKISSKYLKEVGFADEEIREITHCVRAHGPRGLEEPKTLEAKVVYDAEVLSCSVGYIGVARVFDYFMREEGAGVKEMMEVPSGRKGPRKDFLSVTNQKESLLLTISVKHNSRCQAFAIKSFQVRRILRNLPWDQPIFLRYVNSL